MPEVAFDPEAYRERARLASYPNREAEQEAIRAADEFVFGQVRDHERRIMADAKALNDRGYDLIREADTIDTELIESIRVPLQKGKPFTAREADALRDYSKTIEAKIAELLLAADMAEHTEGRLLDTYGDARRLWARFPALRRV